MTTQAAEAVQPPILPAGEIRQKIVAVYQNLAQGLQDIARTPTKNYTESGPKMDRRSFITGLALTAAGMMASCDDRFEDGAYDDSTAQHGFSLEPSSTIK